MNDRGDSLHAERDLNTPNTHEDRANYLLHRTQEFGMDPAVSNALAAKTAAHAALTVFHELRSNHLKEN